MDAPIHMRLRRKVDNVVWLIFFDQSRHKRFVGYVALNKNKASCGQAIEILFITGIGKRVNAHDPRFWMPGEQLTYEMGAYKPSPAGYQHDSLAKSLHCVMLLENRSLIKLT